MRGGDGGRRSRLDRARLQAGVVQGGRHHLEVGTAGSITLVLQACLLAACGSDDALELDITGGTNVKWSPPIDFYREVLFPILATLGIEVELGQVVRGFYPEGGGRAQVRLRLRRPLQPMVRLERGNLRSIEGICFSQNLPQHVCQRISSGIRKAFIGHEVRLRTEDGRGASSGAGCFLAANYDHCTLSADALGERGIPAEKVAERAIAELRKEMASSATVDLHAADQVLPYLALADRPSSFIAREASGHLLTQAELIKRFLPAEISMTRIDRGVKVEVAPQPYI